MKKVIIAILFLFTFSVIHAQSVVSTAGKTSTVSGTSLSYTIGEVGVGYANPNVSVLAGFNQPSVKTSNVSVADLRDISISVFPNPVKNWLNIVNDTKGFISITDINGKVIYSRMEIPSNSKHSIDMTPFAKGVYLLRFSSGNQHSTIKIIKS